jgi:glucose-6-phosphatase
MTQHEWTWLESVRWTECALAQQLQQLCKSDDSFLIQSAHFGHPNVFYSIFFPLFYLLAPSLAALALCTVAMAEYLNTLFKWAFNDDRPYWWIHEIQQNANLTEAECPQLFQVPETCETGPGFPSGHVMISVCVCLVVMRSASQSRWLSQQNLVRRVLWLAVLYYVAVIAVGRVYISAHFIDQAVFGALFGVFSALLIERSQLSTAHFRRLATISIGCLTTALLLQRGLSLLSMDPNWTLRMAKKHCFDPKYAKADTTPSYVVWKTCGSLFGSALTFAYFGKRWRLPSGFGGNSVIGIKLFFGLLLACLVTWLLTVTSPSPTNLSNVQHFYLFTYIQHALLPIVVHFTAYYFGSLLSS